jgi:hypothetical protein
VKVWRKENFKAARAKEQEATKGKIPWDFTPEMAQWRVDNLRARYADLVLAQAEFTEEFGEPSKQIAEAMWYVRHDIGKYMAGIATGKWEGRARTAAIVRREERGGQRHDLGGNNG